MLFLDGLPVKRIGDDILMNPQILAFLQATASFHTGRYLWLP